MFPSNSRTLNIILNRNEVAEYLKAAENRVIEIEKTKQNRNKLNNKTPAKRLVETTTNHTNELLSPTKRIDASSNESRKHKQIKQKKNDESKSEASEMEIHAAEEHTIEIVPSKRKRNNPADNEKAKSETPGIKTRSHAKNQTIEATTSSSEPVNNQEHVKSLSIQTDIRTKASKSVRSKRPKIPKVIKNALMPTLYKYQLVWAYIKGYPTWPGVIEDFMPNGKYLIHFFGDYTRAEVTRRFIVNYFDGFNNFECNFGNNKLKKAVEEAKYFLFGNDDINECYVCKILELKRQLNQGKNF